MSVRITDLPEASELNGSELMPIVQNGVTRRTTLDFVNQAAPAALILQQTQQVLADTQQVKADTDQVLVNTEGVYNQTVMVQGQVEISIADWETQYLGAKSDPPTTDNEGNPLQNGALYWDTSLNAMFVWNGTSWTAFSSAVASVNGQIGEVVLDYADVGAANSGANNNITSMSGVTGDIGSATGLQFDTLTPSATAVGKLTWNVEDSTLDLGMAGTVVQQIGQEMFYSVQNQTGFPINDGSVVRAVGTLNTSGRILVAPATADGVYPSHTFMGVVTETIQDGDPGLVTFFGKVRDIDTTGAIYGETWVDGDILYAHPGAAGGLTKVKPQAPNNIVMVALVIKAAVSGTLFVRTTYGSNLRDDELVHLNGLADGDVLQYDADLGRFENRTLSGAGIEPFGAAADSMVAHLAALDPHPQYTTAAEASAAAPVQSVAGRTGAVSLTKADVGLANVDNTSDADKPVSTATQNALNLKLNSNDPSVTNAREWTAETVSQVEAEAGTATTRRAWTAQRVSQAIAAWWNASAFKTKLDGIQAGAQVNTVNSVAGKVGIVTLVKGDVGLTNVDNTSDLNKPVSTAQAAAIAASSSFQQAGAGAVVRTVQDKLREQVSVKDFGAVGDGVTNDLAAINAAAAYAKTIGGALVFPAGYTFGIQGRIIVENGVREVTGAGRIKCLAGPNMCGILLAGIHSGKASNVMFCNVHDLFIDANNQWAVPIFGENVQYCSIVNNHIQGAVRGYGISLRAFSDGGNQILGNRVIGNAIVGNGGTDPQFNGIALEADLNFGVHPDVPTYWKATYTAPAGFLAVANNIVANNQVDGGYYGISLSGASYNQIVGNRLNSNVRGISCQNSSIGNNISNNTILDNISSGVHLAYGSTSNKIHGNKIYSTRAAGQGFIQAYVGCNLNEFSDNTCFATSAPNYYIYAGVMSNNNRFINNTVVGPCAKAYIAVEAAWDTAVGNAAHYATGLNPIVNNYANAGMSGTELIGNKILPASAVPAIFLSSITDGAQRVLSDTLLKDNVVHGNSPNYQLEMYEETASGVTTVISSNNSFDPAATAAKFLLPRGKAHFRWWGGSNQLDFNLINYQFTSLDTTPDVGVGSRFECVNGGATSITYFDGGADGQEIQIRLDLNTTIVHNASFIRCRGNVNIVGATVGGSNAFVAFRRISGVWFEQYRNF